MICSSFDPRLDRNPADHRQEPRSITVRKWLLILGLILLAVWALPPDARSQQKPGDAKNKVEDATSDDYAQLNNLRDVVGTLTQIDQNTPTVSFKVSYQTVDPKNSNSLNTQQIRLQQLLAQQQQALTIKNPAQRQNRLAQLQAQINRAQQQSLANMKTIPHYKGYELLPTNKVEVRWQKPKTQYDDKGNVIEYTADQLRKLRGNDPNKVGYEGNFEDLAAGQTVKLYLLKSKKPAPAKDSAPDDKTKKDDKSDDPFAGRPRISMVLILSEPNNPVTDVDQLKGKKK
jgi:hypothetical protein